jgi:hypothetical protein
MMGTVIAKLSAVAAEIGNSIVRMSQAPESSRSIASSTPPMGRNSIGSSMLRAKRCATSTSKPTSCGGCALFRNADG